MTSLLANQAAMAQAIGGLQDNVRLVMNGDDVHIAESWDIMESVMAQPAVWSLRLGSSASAASIIERYPPGTPFQMYVGSALQMSGKIDAIGASGQATQVTIRGRDALAPLHDSGIEKLRSFKDDSYSSLVKWALEQVGLDPKKLITSNAANRKLKAGIPIAELRAPQTNDLILEEKLATNQDVVGQIIHQEHQNKINETALSFCRRHLDRAGLMLWATADGHFVLSLPNGQQPASYKLIRRRDGKGVANVVDYDYENDVTHRHAEATVFARSGGRKHGRVLVESTQRDDEMWALGYRTRVIFRDANVQNKTQADFFANRKLAEERRAGYRLSYTVPGHTLPRIGGGEGVVTCDTVINVFDEVLGIVGNFYIESVRRMRQAKTLTTIRLMRLGDLLFGGDP